MLGDRQFAHIVQKRGSLNGFELPLLCHPEPFREFCRVNLNTANVPMSDLILGIHGHRQCFDGRQV